MGIAIFHLEHLLHLKKNHPSIFVGEVLQLGRQDCYFSPEDVRQKAALFGVDLLVVGSETRENPNNGRKDTASDIFLFRSLGFDVVSSLDFSDIEAPSIIHDLNLPVPDSLHHRFKVIYDSGTTEHIFDTASVFRNIHESLAPGGVIIHESPTNNCVDHGFWQLSPTLFADAYTTNGYEKLEMLIVKAEADHLNTGPYQRLVYDPLAFRAMSIGRHGSEVMATFCAFRKRAQHAPWVVPTQGVYASRKG